MFKFILFFGAFTCTFSCATHRKYPKKNLKFKDSSKLSSDFDICPWWNRRFDWVDHMYVKSRLERPGLIKYVDKIQSNKMMRDLGFKVITVYYSSNKKVNFVDKLNEYHSYVAKPSHMSANNGLVIIENGINILTKKKMTSVEVQNAMFELLKTPTNSDEWYLQNTVRGFLIQEYIKKRQELKLQTIWGRVVGGAVLNGETMNVDYYDREGSPLSGLFAKDPPQMPYPNLWKKAIIIAEKIAKRTDALRVDLMIKFNKDGSKELLVNELEIRSQNSGPKKYSFSRLINLGYIGMCVKN